MHITASVNAGQHGFLPQNSAEQNASALQALCDRAGTIVVDLPGTYDLCETIRLKDDTQLVFGAGVYLRRARTQEGSQIQSYVFVNEGAYARRWNRNITITGLKLIANGMQVSDAEEQQRITGLQGHLAFFYIRNLVIRDFELLDLGKSTFGIHVCTFENVLMENLHIEGYKDAVHFGKGSKFVLRHGIFRTFDDPVALNAHDYATSNPQMGWIENGLIEDCYDLDQPETTGFFCRILAGSWGDWREGMVVQHSDSVVSNGRVYRVVMQPDGQTYVSHTRPTHAQGMQQMDGICWAMVQDDNPIYICGCRNIHFRDIFLEKKRPVAFSVHFDHDNWSRSFYPYSDAPVQKDLIFENIFFLNEIPTVLTANAPVNTVKFINSVIDNSRVHLRNLELPGLSYGRTQILFSGCTFKGAGAQTLVQCAEGREATLKLVGSVVEDESYCPHVCGPVQVLASDIALEKE